MSKIVPKDGVLPNGVAKPWPELQKKKPKLGGGMLAKLSQCFGLGQRGLKPRQVGGGMRGRSTSTVRRKDFDGSFCEHTWDLRQLKDHFQESHIDEQSPKKSLGMEWVFARAQLALKGPNVLPKPKEVGNWELFLRQFWNMLWALLIGASCLSLLQFFLDTNEIVNLWVTLILFGMIVVMCICSWLQEMRAQMIVRGFQRLLPQCCWVIREGKESTISAPELVVGDLVLLRAGQRVPADLRLLHCVQLKLEASSITGESEPLEYQAEEVAERVGVFDARNVAFNGSLCIEGEGLGVVIRVGENTVIGQTARLTTQQRPNSSRLEAQIRKYVEFLIVMACSVALVVFLVGGFVHMWTNMVQLLANGFLVCAIGMVPCGLPATVTSILTLIARRLASRNVYVKRLDICEALGQVSIIGSDKTGTLTKNQMRVTGLWHRDTFVRGYPQSEPIRQYVAEEGDQKLTRPARKGAARYGQPVDQMLMCMAVCNTAVLGGGDDDKKLAAETETVEMGGQQGQEEEVDEAVQKGTRSSSRKSSFKALVWGQTGSSGDHQQQQQRSISRAENGGVEVLKAADSAKTQKVGSRPVARKAMAATAPATAAAAMGPPSEAAMLDYANTLTDVGRARREHEDVAFEVPFNSKRKWHLKIVRQGVHAAEADYLLLMKGAPEVLSQMCSKILAPEGEQQFGPGAGLEQLEDAYSRLAGEGHRVIGFASARFQAPVDVEFSMDAANFPLAELTFLGACAIMDPPREETAEAIRQCKTAGIKVFMITGDHHLTACAIARQIGLIEGRPQLPSGLQLCNGGLDMTLAAGGGDYAVVQGAEISCLSAAQWDELVLRRRSVVFARTTPEQKLLIVEQCQRRGQIMAMTGDGVNDAPALKKAHIGIAMGSGSEVAKQAADIVLMDDNFSSIVHAVEEGRVMYENIKKLLAYTMPHSFPEVWPIIINFCFGMPVGITALQILSIDLGTELFPGVSLSKEPAEGDVMSRPPRAMKKVLISNTLLAYAYLYTGQIQSLGCFLAYCCVFWSHGIAIGDLWMSALNCWQKGGDIFYSNGRAFSVQEQLWIGRQATSAWQMGIVFGQFFNIWSARTRRASVFRHGLLSNKPLLFALVVELLLICSFVYMPGLNEFLGGGPIPWQCWAVVAGVGLFINAYNEVRKWFIRHFPKNPVVRLFKW